MSEHTIEAPAIEVPAAPPRERSPARRRSASELLYAYRWLLAAIALLAVSTVVVLWADTRPGYDPYGWLVWGKLSLHLKLDTNGAPSWKPLPYLFTVPFAVVGHYALWLWMIASVAISLSGVIFAWRIAFHLTAAPPERRYAAYAAGLFAGGLVLVMLDPLGYGYSHYLLSAESDTMIVAICLAAIDCHLCGRHRLAFWLWWLGSLGRPEVWPFWALAGIWLWRALPGYRRWVITSVVLLLLLWFGIPGLTSKSFLTAGNIAENSPRAIQGNKITGTLHRFLQLESTPVWIAAAVTVAVALWRRQRAILILVAGALAWVVIEVAFALHGFPAVPRYMFEPGAIVAVLAGVFVGRVILELPALLTRVARALRRDWLPSRLAQTIGGWGAAIVVVVFAGLMLPAVRTQVRLERADLKQERARTTQLGQLSTVVSRLGVAKIFACGQPKIPIAYQSVLAWYMGVKVGELYVSDTAEQLHPSPLVNIYPIRSGWKVFATHVPPGSTTCRRMRLIYRSRA